MPERKASTEPVPEQRLVERLGADQTLLTQIIPQQGHRAVHQRHHSRLSPFSGEADLGGALQAHIAHRQIDQLLRPCSRIVEEAQEDGGAPPRAMTQVRLVEDGGQALRREVFHSRRRTALERMGQDTLTAEQEPGSSV